MTTPTTTPATGGLPALQTGTGSWCGECDGRPCRRYALVHGQPVIEDVRFRMLQPHEIGAAMAFADDYRVLGSKRDRIRQYGNAVTPNAAEVLLCALVEAITGEEIVRYLDDEPAPARSCPPCTARVVPPPPKKNGQPCHARVLADLGNGAL